MSDISTFTTDKIWLAPLAGFTDRAFRLICKICGADVTVTEMVSADGLVFDYERSARYAFFSEEERPTGIQLFGSRPEMMAKGCELILPLKPDFIDINMGCPVKKVVNRGAGSALLKDIGLAVEIVKTMKEVLQDSGIPLSAKIRAGWDKESINIVDAALALEDAGVDFIIVHPRTRSQFYVGKSDWSLIAAVKSAVKIPVVGNGDIIDIKDAVRMREETGCDSIMVGRGALGKPWIFNEIKSYLLTGKPFTLSYKEKYEIIRFHTELALSQKAEEWGLKEMRVHYCHYTRGFKGGSRVRDIINKSIDQQEIIGLIGELYEERDRQDNLADKV